MMNRNFRSSSSSHNCVCRVLVPEPMLLSMSMLAHASTGDVHTSVLPTFTTGDAIDILVAQTAWAALQASQQLPGVLMAWFV
mmetsp:Transcript_3435/g.7506  ORF Transcript_3435/g.7506 Transcript_3435/m.7506 type:complete len:82 (+) Transcript_3435:197-442(+)